MTERRAGASRGLSAGISVFRSLALTLIVAWALLSITGGGLRQAVATAWLGVRSRGLGLPGHLDARKQWAGPYYDALDYLSRQPRDATTTLAVVLFPSRRTDFPSGVNPRLYEAMYRFYPLRPDIYVANATGAVEPRWFESPKSQVPAIPPLWEHSYVIWSGSGPAPAATGYRLLFANEETRVYQAEAR